MLSRIPLGLLHNKDLVQSQTNRTVAVIKYLLFTERPSLTSGPPPTTTTLTTTIKKTYTVKGDSYGSRLNEINVIQSQKKTKEDAEYYYETTSSTNL